MLNLLACERRQEALLIERTCTISLHVVRNKVLVSGWVYRLIDWKANTLTIFARYGFMCQAQRAYWIGKLIKQCDPGPFSQCDNTSWFLLPFSLELQELASSLFTPCLTFLKVVSNPIPFGQGSSGLATLPPLLHWTSLTLIKFNSTTLEKRNTTLQHYTRWPHILDIPCNLSLQYFQSEKFDSDKLPFRFNIQTIIDAERNLLTLFRFFTASWTYAGSPGPLDINNPS